MSDLSKYATDILKEYAKEKGNTVRSTSDLSPLEKWLIKKLFENNQKFIGFPRSSK